MARLYLCITPFFPSPDNWRGAYIHDQVKAIARNSDYDVHVFKIGPFPQKGIDYTIDGVTVHYVQGVWLPSYLFNGITDGINGRIFCRKLTELGFDLRDIDVAHCHTANFASFGMALKIKNPTIKVVLQFHDLDPFCVRNGKFHNCGINQRYRARKSLHYINAVDLNLCISEPVRDALLSFPQLRSCEVYEGAQKMYQHLSDFPSAKPKTIYVLNNGVDTSLFKPNVHKKNTEIFRIGCIANFWDLKDHQTLVQAFNILHKKGYQNLRLSLLGSGPTRNSIEQFIIKNGLSGFVEWPTEVHHHELPTFYNTLDLFVLPSRFEGFGCVFTEAYACGVPFICCENQGASELIVSEEREHWLVSDRNPEQLARLIEDQYIQHNKQHLSKDYDINILIKNYLSFIESL